MATDGTFNAKPLLVLLRATSEKDLHRVLDGVFHARSSHRIPAFLRGEVTRILRLEGKKGDDDAAALFGAVRSLLWRLIDAPTRPAEGAPLASALSELLPEASFHPDLREVLTAMLAASTPRWRVEALEPRTPPSPEAPAEGGGDEAGAKDAAGDAGGTSAEAEEGIAAAAAAAAAAAGGNASGTSASAKSGGKSGRRGQGILQRRRLGQGQRW